MTKPLRLAATGGGPATYSEDVFNTYLYTGNGSTQTVTTGVDTLTDGGAIWFKGRQALAGGFNHQIIKPDPSPTNDLFLDTASSAGTSGTTSLSRTTTGFTLDAAGSVNYNTQTFVAWTFKKKQKFFEVVTYTGTGANRTIAHNLGAVPGCILVKRTDTTGDWQVYHRSLVNTEYAVLNSTAAKATGATRWNSTTPTASAFSVGTDVTVNASGGSYVAYLFANDAGGFGANGVDNIISCGSYTGNGSATGPTITLGYEPQWLMIKNISGTGSWQIIDTMRGLSMVGNAQVVANTAGAESTTQFVAPSATGFQVVSTSTEVNTNLSGYIYVVIRRGSMRVPTTGTSVLGLSARSGTGANATVTGGAGPTDLAIIKNRGAVADPFWALRLTGTEYLLSSGTAAAATAGATTLQASPWDVVDGIKVGTTDALTNASGNTFINYLIKRAPGFFDVVCDTGTGTTKSVSHGLGVVPELMIRKSRSGVTSWPVYAPGPSSYFGQAMTLESTVGAASSGTAWSNTPTINQFSVYGSSVGGTVNSSGVTYTTLLFASCPGVSKVGSYTGTGTTQQIDCGFAGGARFVMIKRIDPAGGAWYVWDTARGIASGNDPYLLVNSTAAEVANTNYINPLSSGFEISSTAGADINELGGSVWSSRTSGFGTDQINFVTRTLSPTVAAGANGTLTSSTDGTTWTARTPGFGTNQIYGVAFGAGLFVAVGQTGLIRTTADITSATWTTRTNPSGTNTLNTVTFANGLFVAAGAAGVKLTSTDGITWTTRAASTYSVYDIAFGAGLYVAVGLAGQLETSPDGITWTARTSGFGSAYIRSITFGNGVFVAVGDSGTLATSSDGITWTLRTSGFGTTNINSVTFATYPAAFVAAGDSGTLATSSDGITWTARTSGFGTTAIKSVGYNSTGQVWVAGGASGTMTASLSLPKYTFLAIA